MGRSPGVTLWRQATLMNGIDSILCVVDPAAEAGCAGVSKAARMARAFGAARVLLICSVPPRPAEEDGRLSHRLEQLAKPLQDLCPKLSTRLIIGQTLHQSLLDYIGDASFDLVIKEAIPACSSGRAIRLCVDEHLIRWCAPPLLLTHGRSWGAEPTILACIDPGHARDPGAILDHCILQAGQAFSRQLGGCLHALHAWHHRMPQALNGGGPIAMRLSCEAPEQQAVTRLAYAGALSEEYHIDADRVHLNDLGACAGVVQQAAALHADIVVIGETSRKNRVSPLFGHIAERVLGRLQCDALVVKVPCGVRG